MCYGVRVRVRVSFWERWYDKKQVSSCSCELHLFCELRVAGKGVYVKFSYG